MVTASRGKVYTDTETPTPSNGMADDDIEAYRRWYAMAALVNIWDVSKAVPTMPADAHTNDRNSIRMERVRP